MKLPAPHLASGALVRLFWSTAALVLVLLSDLAVQAENYHPRISQLTARNSQPQNLPSFGNSVAANHLWIVSGEPRNDDVAEEAGAVHVFDARTGRLRHKFTFADGETNDHFGGSVALHGSWLAVGAHDNNGGIAEQGVVLVYDLTTGNLVHTLRPTGASLAFSSMGASVAINEHFVVAGAVGRNQSQGAVFVFDRETGDQLFELEASDGANSDFFGDSVALSDHLLLVGAPGDGGGIGSIYLFDALRGTQIDKVDNPDGGANDWFGTAVAFSGNRIVVGAHRAGDSDEGRVYVFDAISLNALLTINSPVDSGLVSFGKCLGVEGNLLAVGAESALGVRGSISGVVYLFDLARGVFLQELFAPDGGVFDNFGGTSSNSDYGNSVAVCGNEVFVGSPRQDVGSREGIGAVYRFEVVAGPVALDPIAARRDFVPGVDDVFYNQFQDVSLNGNGEALFSAALAGSGASRGRRFAMISDVFSRGYATISQSGVDFGGNGIPVRFAAFTNNQQDLSLFSTFLRGPGITGQNNQFLFGYDGNSDPFQVLRTGDLDPVLGGVIRRIGEFAQARMEFQGQAACVQLTPGLNGVTPTDDSAILFIEEDGDSVEAIREGDASPLPGAEPYGFLNRVSYPSDYATFRAGVQTDPTANQMVVRHRLGQTARVLAQKGAEPPGIAGAAFSTFLGETGTSGASSAFRALVRGPGVTGANNEGLWTQRNNGSAELVARKGDPVAAIGPNVVFARFLQFGMNYDADVIFVAKLRGRGITPANDCALFLAEDGGDIEVLLREGDVAPGCDTARVGTIQRFALGHFGEYAVVTSLTRAPRGRNQALWTGNFLDSDEPELRRPFLQLRKGVLHSSFVSAITRTRSIQLSARCFDRTGAGLKGLGSPLNSSGELALCLQFDNRAKVLMRGKP